MIHWPVDWAGGSVCVPSKPSTPEAGSGRALLAGPQPNQVPAGRAPARQQSPERSGNGPSLWSERHSDAGVFLHPERLNQARPSCGAGPRSSGTTGAAGPTGPARPPDCTAPDCPPPSRDLPEPHPALARSNESLRVAIRWPARSPSSGPPFRGLLRLDDAPRSSSDDISLPQWWPTSNSCDSAGSTRF